jgi:uncharacterized protein
VPLPFSQAEILSSEKLGSLMQLIEPIAIKSPVPRDLKSLTIIFKITERCNLACKYCYFFFGGDTSYEERPAVVPDDVIEGLTRFLASGAEHGIEHVNIMFHGGEPLLMPKPRFAKMCRTLRDNLSRKLKVQFGLQTNCMLVDSEWIDLFQEFSIGVGVSLDGPAEINDRGRVDHKGRGSHGRVTEKWFELSAAAAAGKITQPGILCVIDPNTDPVSVYRHFVDELGAKRVDFLLPDPIHSLSTEHLIEDSERYMLSVFREWSNDLDKNVFVAFIADVFAPLASDQIAASISSKGTDYRAIASVSSNGELGPHDVLRTLQRGWERSELNVKTHTVSDLFASAPWKLLEAVAYSRPEGCADCPWWNLCKGGRLEHRFGLNRSLIKNNTIYCAALKEFYAEVAAHLVAGGISVLDIQRRLGFPRVAE